MNPLNQKPLLALVTLSTFSFSICAGWGQDGVDGIKGSEDGANLAPVFINLQVEGNLKSNRLVPLESMEQATSTDTPVDFMDLSGRKAKAGDYEEAAKAFAVAIAYAQYDTTRVADQTSHQGIQVLIAEKMDGITEEQAYGVQAAGQQLTADGGATLSTMLERLGKPNYHPDYLIQHGMGAFSGESAQGDGIVKDFDGETVWNSILRDARTLGTSEAGEVEEGEEEKDDGESTDEESHDGD